jgi:hypothetical protein
MSRKPKAIDSDPNLAAWCAALASPKTGDTVPPGWRTTRELCTLLGKSDTRVGEMLREAVANGKCERREFRVAAANTVRGVPHYKLT